MTRWHPTKNGKAKQSEANNSDKYWWICDKDHTFLKSKSAMRRFGCPVCKGKQALEGYNDLATTHPDLAREWDYQRNGDLAPTNVIATQSPRIHWKCAAGHEWEAILRNRTVLGTNCPYCSGRETTSGENDLNSLNPALAREWDPLKNGTLTPNQVKQKSSKRVWWKCSRGHSWQQSVAVRANGNGCPFCGGWYIIPGETDFATQRPDLVRQISPDQPWIDLSHEGIGSEVTILWICEQAHHYKAQIKNRVKGSSCPYCAGKALFKGLNDLQTRAPDAERYWDYERNAPLTPADVIAGSGKKYWWKCPEGHRYEQTSLNFFHGRRCATCAESGFDPLKPAILYLLQNEFLEAGKLGITNAGTTRLASFKSKGWLVFKTFEFTLGSEALALEVVLKKWLREEMGIPAFLSKGDMDRLGGHTETFSKSAIELEKVAAQIEELLAFCDRRR